jgi:hypothetical protein
MTQDPHSYKKPVPKEIDGEPPRCPSCGGELEYFESPVFRTAFSEDRDPMFMVDVCCEACEYGCWIFVTPCDP